MLQHREVQGERSSPSRVPPLGKMLACFLLLLLTSAKWNVGKLLPSCRVVLEIAVRFEVQGVLPGVLQALVDGGGHADLMAGGNAVSCDRLQGQRQGPHT